MQDSDTTQNKRPPMPTLIWILLGLAIIISGFYLLLRDDLTAVPKHQLEAISAGNEAEAYTKYTSKDFQESTSLPQFSVFLDLHPLFRKQPTAQLTVTEQKKESATLKGSLAGNDGQTLAVEYKLVKENGEWKIETLTLLDLGPRTQLSKTDNISELQKPINAQLQALLDKNISKAYYNLVSDEFQRSTSFKDFEKFVNENPILFRYTRKEIVNHEIDGNEARVTLKLYQGSLETPVEYSLKRSKGEWKIWGLRLVVPQHSEVTNTPATSQELAAIFEKNITPLRDNNTSKTYYQHTSKAFRSKTPLDTFRRFIDKNNAIKNGQPEYYQGFISEEIAVFKVHFQDTDQPVLLRVTLRKEGGDWKIDSMDPLPAPTPIWAAKPPKIEEKELIAQLDQKEITPTPQQVVPPAPAPLPQNTYPQLPQAAPAIPNSVEDNNILHMVEQHLRSLRNGETPKAYRSYTSQGFKDANNYETFQNFVRTFPIITTVTPRLSIASHKQNMASVTAEFDAPGGVTQVNYLLIKEADNNWKILAIDINVPKILSMPTERKVTPPPVPPIQVTKYDPNPLDLLTPVQQLLSSLSHTDYSAAYKYYTSSGFQKATPYEEFRKALQRLPGIAQESPHFEKPRIEGDTGYVTAKYSGPYGSSNLEFTLIRENNAWKIHVLSISGTSSPSEAQTGTPVTEPPRPLPPENLNVSSVEYPIQKQIYLISSGDINSSYFELTSQSFQRTTNLQEYNDFIHGYAVFTKNASYKIENVETGTENATLKVYMTSDNGEKATVLYDLVRENNAWKILNIQIVETSSPPKGLAHPDKKDIFSTTSSNDRPATERYSSPAALIRLAPRVQSSSTENTPPTTEENNKPNTQQLTFSYGVFGTSVNEQGLIKQPTLNIPKGKTNIYFNLHIENGVPGDAISLTFKHLKSGTTIPEIRSNIHHEGSSTLSFIFAPPPEGWPDGIYEVNVTANNGTTQTYTFRVL